MSERVRVGAASVVIAAALLLQSATLVPDFSFYPFVPYAMYSKAAKAGELRAHRERVTLVTRGGEEIRFLPRGGLELRREPRFGLTVRKYRHRLLKAMLRGSRPAALRLARRLNRHRTDPVVEIRVEVEHFELAGSALRAVGSANHVFALEEAAG